MSQKNEQPEGGCLRELAVKFELLFRNISYDEEQKADAIFLDPYDQLTIYLSLMINEVPELEGAIREFLIKNQGMENSNMQELYIDGYDLQSVYKEAKNIVDYYISKRKERIF